MSNDKTAFFKNLLVVSFLSLGVIQSFAKAAPIDPGSLIITEIMANPAAVSDSLGEWFELTNVSASSIDLNGLVLSDDGIDTHTIDNGGSLIIAPNQLLVFGRNDDISLNGGYVPDYVYSNFNLANFEDEIVLSQDGTEILRLIYTAGSNISVSGISAELDIGFGIPPNQFDYVLTVAPPYGMGDIGTPGAAGITGIGGVAPVPLPPAMWLFGSGLLGMAAVARRRKGI